MQTQVDGQIQIIAGLWFLDLNRPLLMPQGIGFDHLLSCAAPEKPVVGVLHAILADNTALMKTPEFRFLQLVRRHFPDVSQQMRRGQSRRVVPLRFRLDHDAWKIQTMRFDERCLPQRESALQFPGEQFGSTLGQPLAKARLIEPDEADQPFDQGFAISDILEGDVQIEAGHIVREQHPIPVIDQTTGRLEDDGSGPVILGKIPIVLALSDLKVPQTNRQEGDDQQ